MRKKSRIVEAMSSRDSNSRWMCVCLSRMLFESVGSTRVQDACLVV